MSVVNLKRKNSLRALALRKMKYGYVVFDMDGTLIDTCEAIQQSLRDTIVMLTGKTPAKAEMRATFGTPSDVGLKMLGVRDEDIQRGILLWSENIKKYEDTPRAFPGVRELMDGLKAGGCRIGIATSKNAAELEHSREQFGDVDFIVHIPAGVDAEQIRADIEKYRAALTTYKIDQR